MLTQSALALLYVLAQDFHLLVSQTSSDSEAKHQHSPLLQLQLYFMQQLAYMLLSGTSVDHRVGVEQLQEIRGKTQITVLCNISKLHTAA